MEPILTMHKRPFQMSTRDMNQAAVARAAGLYVEVLRQAASRRCVFYFDDTAEIRDLIDRYERRECLPIPVKSVLNARTELYYEAVRAVREAS